LQKAAELRYGTLMELDKRLTAENSRLADMQKSGRMLKEEVDEEDVAEVVAGQREAIVAVSNAVRRARSGLSDPNRPIGSFLFLGPTGVGKTELARALA